MSDSPEAEAKLAAEATAIKLGIADVILAWSRVETWMFLLLGTLTDEGGECQMAEAIYFTPAALEVRINIVDSAFRQLFEIGHYLPEYQKTGLTEDIGKEILEEWKKTLNVLGRLRKTRNKVAHSEMHRCALDDDGNNVVLRLGSVKYQPYVNGQPPGLTANDLAVSAKAVLAISQAIPLFIQMVNRLRDERHPTLPVILGQVRGLRQNLHHPDSQTAPEL